MSVFALCLLQCYYRISLFSRPNSRCYYTGLLLYRRFCSFFCFFVVLYLQRDVPLLAVSVLDIPAVCHILRHLRPCPASLCIHNAIFFFRKMFQWQYVFFFCSRFPHDTLFCSTGGCYAQQCRLSSFCRWIYTCYVFLFRRRMFALKYMLLY
jgi:hypothetical protein